MVRLEVRAKDPNYQAIRLIVSKGGRVSKGYQEDVPS